MAGEYQAPHEDARGDLQEWGREGGGGQRLVQLICYLNSLHEHQGGETAFLHSALGSALVFFPTFRDGKMDPRMRHCGQKVCGGVEKWIVGTWLCEQPITSDTHRGDATRPSRADSFGCGAIVKGSIE
ncbi:unnamed protein product [Vitrella brassicaformis CCMP3155]|uniref:Prolyl 4-hydroxylase alpha subunit Fe(2+) 2OG dioxygenase domain-containing protein n=1 Tax=Vitrella brassicaformis (strain CCMP3155) TaxID=1169540 RepID=A0A0G4FRQ1_VITBC|nr:unnamed protein product [Vitrella brassicaformis CCMP3155]|eukprot:CEM17328.1 unnamed protein product [Vitrella brassicaformis CCMP3155]